MGQVNYWKWQLPAVLSPEGFAKNSAWSICMQILSEGRLTQWLGLCKGTDSSGSNGLLRIKSRTSAIISEYISLSESRFPGAMKGNHAVLKWLEMALECKMKKT